jgi:hypothetical protein
MNCNTLYGSGEYLIVTALLHQPPTPMKLFWFYRPQFVVEGPMQITFRLEFVHYKRTSHATRWVVGCLTRSRPRNPPPFFLRNRESGKMELVYGIIYGTDTEATT